MATLTFDLSGGKMVNQDTGKVQKTTKIEIGEELNDTKIKFVGDAEGQVVATLNGDDITITAYGLDKNGDVSNKVLGTITIKNGSSTETIDEELNGIVLQSYDWTDQALITYPYELGDLTAKKSLTLNGSDLSEKYSGGTKADKIFTKGGYDYIEAGKGNDTITLGSGYKSITSNIGDGNDVISVEREARGNVGVSLYIEKNAPVYTTAPKGTEALKVEKEAKILEPSSSTFTFKKNFQDLTITATREDGTTDSVTLKRYFDVSLNEYGLPIKAGIPGDYSYAYLNDSWMEDEFYYMNYGEHIEVGGIKVSDILNMKLADVMPVGVKGSSPSEIDPEKVTIGQYLTKYVAPGLSIPSGLKNINLFLGTEYNDSFTGTTGKDVMVSGGGYNEFTTGTKGQTVILSMNQDDYKKGPSEKYTKLPNDIYEVSSFTAGTAIIDNDGDYALHTSGVDTNDIHLLSLTLNTEEVPSSLYFTGSVTTTETTALTYITDSKGVKNFEDIDYKGIAKKVMDLVHPGEVKASSSEKDMVKGVNNLISTATGLIDKFRGVAMVSKYETEDAYPFLLSKSSYSPKHYEDLYVQDNTKAQNEHIISATSQEASDLMTAENFEKLFSYACRKYGFGSGSSLEKYYYSSGMNTNMLISMGEFLIDIERYYITGEDAESAMAVGSLSKDTLKKYYKYDKKTDVYTLNDKAYKEIKASIFNVFQDSYVGTDGDNTYTISKSEMGTAIASGAGSDTFTLKGDMINSLEKYTYESKALPYVTAKGKIEPVTSTRSINMGIQNYNIVSEFNKDEYGMVTETDKINITNYSFDKDSLYMRPVDDIYSDEDGVWFNGLSLQMYDVKKGNYASLSYGIGDEYYNYYGMKAAVKGGIKPIALFDDNDNRGFNIAENKFENLTITDGSKKTFNVTAEYDDTGLTYNWTNNTDNHIAITYTKDAIVRSNSGTNIINADSFVDDYDYYYNGYSASLTYTYGGGNDKVYSTSYYSDDLYTVESFDKNTKLLISDDGGYDDTLTIGNKDYDADNVRLFFNVESDGDFYYSQYSFVTADNLKKGNFTTMQYSSYYGETEYEATVNNGISCQGYIENFNIGDKYFDDDDMYNIQAQIAGDVAGWLNSDANKKGYSDVAEVLAKGSSKEISQVLAYYDNALDSYLQA